MERLLKGRIVQQHPYFKPDPLFLVQLARLLETQTFIPAGNTLAYGGSNTLCTASQLRPNCSVFEQLDAAEAACLWAKGIGVGMTCSPAENPVPLLHEYQAQWNRIHLGHRPQRGNMFVYRADGSYIHQFIECKNTNQKADALNAFNLSLGVDSQVAPPHDLVQRVAQAIYNTGDPGLVFLDRINNKLPLMQLNRRINTTVPCGEQGMYDGEFCTLGAINLNSAELCKHANTVICMDKLKRAVRTAVTFLDNAVDVCSESGARQYRRIGLGVMGWADYLHRVAIPYGSTQAVNLAAHLSMSIGAVARHQSYLLARTRGVFPALKKAQFAPNADLLMQDFNQGYVRDPLVMRNVSVTCIAPTGGISLLTGNRGFAIEPFFADSIRIAPADHLRVADAWQTGMCNSVSKTVNLREDCTVRDIVDAIHHAYELKHIKAASFYRTNSRFAQPIKT